MLDTFPLLHSTLTVWFTEPEDSLLIMADRKKVRAAMGLHKSPKHDTLPPPLQSQSSTMVSPPSNATIFSRLFGVFFPRTSAQVQPRPPDVIELIRLVEELRDRESRLNTELLEFKLLRESVEIIPVLENEILTKSNELDRSYRRIEGLESENERLRRECEELRLKFEEEMIESERKLKAMEIENAEMKIKTIPFENDEKLCSQRFQGLVEISMKSNLIKSLTKRSKSADIAMGNHENRKSEEIVVDCERPSSSWSNSDDLAESTRSNIRSRIPRVPKPPPRRSSSSPSPSSSSSSAIPPPPPPPPMKGMKAMPSKVRRVPEVVEFYHSLTRRDSRRDSSAATTADALASSNARDVNLIGEIENRSAHLLVIKTDVETQGDFIRILIEEVENAAFTDIEDVGPFVKWLDNELSYLVDERAVLKHFNWPEQKADALREAAFEYCDLKKLEFEVSSFRDNPRQPCSPAIKKMQALLEKLEHGAYNLSRMRESAAKRYKLFQIPMDWILENGFVSQIKLASVKLAMKYMRRVSTELEAIGGSMEEEELIVQAVRFAFRVHQFAGGFDGETMRAFSELRDKARSCQIQCQN